MEYTLDNSKGQVLIYKPLDLFHFELVKTLSIPPVGALGSYQFGFGQKVSISSDNVIAIAAGLYGVYNRHIIFSSLLACF